MLEGQLGAIDANDHLVSKKKLTHKNRSLD